MKNYVEKPLSEIKARFGSKGAKDQCPNVAVVENDLKYYQQLFPEIDKLEEEIQEILNYLYSIYSIYAQAITGKNSQIQGNTNGFDYPEYVGLVNRINKALDLAYKAKQEFPLKGFREFVAFYLKELSKLSIQAHNEANAETPWVKQKKNEVWLALNSGNHVLLIGETGTGKTMLAKELARLWNEGDLLMISGSGFTTVGDLTKKIGLKASNDLRDPQEIESIIVNFEQQLNKMNIDDDLRQRIRAIFDKGLSSKVPETVEILSPVFKAYIEGKTVVIDEITFIPAKVTAVIYDMLADKNAINKGFRVIFTGNYGEKYSGLETMNPAFWNRVGAVVNYKTLPLDDRVSDLSQSILTVDSDSELPARDLYQLALSFLAEENGLIYGPALKNQEVAVDDSIASLPLLKKVWNSVQAFAVLQDSFSGERPLELDGQEYVLKKASLSIRQLRSIFESWKKEVFYYELDVYLYESIIRPALAIDKQEALVMFDLFGVNYGFFQAEKWKKMRERENFQTYNKKDFVNTQLQKTKYITEKENIIVPATHEVRMYPIEIVAQAFVGRATSDNRETVPPDDGSDELFKSLEEVLNDSKVLVDELRHSISTDQQLVMLDLAFNDLRNIEN